MKHFPFLKNGDAVSLMYDAVLFLIMVSFSGLVLLPVLQCNIATDTSVDHHREVLVDETLLMLMTARDDDFGYLFAGSQVDALASDIGINISNEESFFYAITHTLLGNEQQHKTYADLCVENLVSQMKVFGCRLNIFTEDYDVRLLEEMTLLLQDHLGDKYQFNLSIRWYPIVAVPFGGDLFLGPPAPSNTYVASTYLSMPDTFFSTWWNAVEQFIDVQLSILEPAWTTFMLDGNKTTFCNVLEACITSTITGILFDGFDLAGLHINSVLEEAIDYVFGKIQGTIESAFTDALAMISDSLGVFNSVAGYIDLSNGLTTFLLENITTLPGIESFINISNVDISSALDGLKCYVVNESRDFFSDILEGSIKQVVDVILAVIEDIDDVETIEDDIMSFFTQQINVLRAECTLTIWEVRG